MGDILGIGTTHYPPGLVPEEYKPWPLARMLHTDPRIPAHLKDPANWPEPMRAEWGDDEGITSFKAHRARVFSAFRTLRDEIDAFRPDFILMWGDDQYENFQEDIIPPFCVLAYDTLEFQPFKRLGKPAEHLGRAGGQDRSRGPDSRPRGGSSPSRLLEAGIDMPYAYRPLHGDGVAHAFANTLLYLDLDRPRLLVSDAAGDGELLRPRRDPQPGRRERSTAWRPIRPRRRRAAASSSGGPPRASCARAPGAWCSWRRRAGRTRS